MAKIPFIARALLAAAMLLAAATPGLAESAVSAETKAELDAAQTELDRHRASGATQPMGRLYATLVRLFVLKHCGDRAVRFGPLASLARTCGGLAPRRASRLAREQNRTVKWCHSYALCSSKAGAGVGQLKSAGGDAAAAVSA